MFTVTRAACRRRSRVRQRPETSELPQLPQGKGGGQGQRRAAGAVESPGGAVRSAERTNAPKAPDSEAAFRGRARAWDSTSVRAASSAAKGKEGGEGGSFTEGAAAGARPGPRAPAARLSLEEEHAPPRARPERGGQARPGAEGAPPRAAAITLPPPSSWAPSSEPAAACPGGHPRRTLAASGRSRTPCAGPRRPRRP